MLGADQVAQLCAHHDTGALGVFAHQRIPQAQVLSRVDLDQLQCANFTGLFGYIKRRCHRRAKASWRSALSGPQRIAILPSGHDLVTRSLELAQRLGAARDLSRTATVGKAKVPANCIGPCGATRMCAATEKLSDRFDRVGLLECSLDLVLLLHQPR